MGNIEEVRNKQIETVKEKVEELLDMEKVKEIIKTNTAEFEYEGITYRVRKPSFKERQELYKLRCEKQVELLQETNDSGNFKYLAEKDLKNLYQKRGIDIDKMNRQINTFIIKEKALLDKLGKALKEEAPNSQLESMKLEIVDLREGYADIAQEKTSLFEFSIENQLLMFIYNYYAFLCTEKKVVVGGKEDSWAQAWKTQDEFFADDEVLITIANSYITILLNEQS